MVNVIVVVVVVIIIIIIIIIIILILISRYLTEKINAIKLTAPKMFVLCL